MAREVLEEEKTKLEEDALIYSKRDPDGGKEEYEKLDRKGKLQFFKDYYLKTILAVILIAVFGGYYIAEAINKPHNVLYIAIEGDVFSSERVHQMELDIEKYLSLGPKEKVVINTDFSSDNLQSWQQLQTYLYSGTADIVIANKEAFTRWAECGYFLEPDSSQDVAFYRELEKKDRLYTKYTTSEEFRQGKEEDDTMYNYGISIIDSEKYKSLGGLSDTAYAGICNASKHVDEAVAFLQYLLDDSIKAGSVNPEFAGE